MMTVLRPLLATPFLLFALPTVAAAVVADGAARDLGDWTVAPSQDGKGCFLTRQYDHPGRTTLLVGLDRDGTNHLTVLNADWSIRPRERLKLTFRLSNGAYPGHFAVGMTADGKRGFVTSFEPRFPQYLARSRTLNIARGKVPVERLDLDGSGAAVAALRDCVARRTAPSSSDNSGRPADIPRDPFARSLRRD